jgi:hypothetical protein
MSSKLKGVIITILIMLSLIPLSIFYKYLQRIFRAKQSLGRFFLFVLVSMILIFGYTFLVVLLIKIIFRVA